MKKRKFVVCALATSVLLSPLLVRAAVAPGETFNASASCGNYEGALNVSVSNATLVSGSNWCDRGGTVNAEATAGGSGTASISFTVVDATDLSDPANPRLVGDVNIGGTSVSVVTPSKPSTPSNNQSNSNSNSSPSNSNTKPVETPKPEIEPKDDLRSKDNDLKSLSVNEGILSPTFNKSKTSYKVNLPATATSITVKATANDAKAHINGTGTIKLQVGENEVNITVTSEYGTKKTYTIKVYVDEKPLVYTQFNGEKLGVVRNINGVKVPDNFKNTKVKLDGKEITAWENKKMNKTIVYLSNEKDDKAFYLYENGKVTSQFTYKKILGRSFYLISVPKEKQVIEGMQFGEIKIDNTKLMGWTFKEKTFKDYAVFMVMDMDGETRYYQYDNMQNTLQRYSQAAPVTRETYAQQMKVAQQDKQEKMIWMYVAIISIILTVIGIGGCVYLKKKK